MALAFFNCKSLESIKIPKVTGIGTNAFVGCMNLKKINLEGIKHSEHIDVVEFLGKTERVNPVTITFADVAIQYKHTGYKHTSKCHNKPFYNKPFYNETILPLPLQE